MTIKDTKTEINLMKSFCGESQARNRYNFFSKQAKKEGFVQVANIFEEIAAQEKAHAKSFFNYLEGGEVEITDKFPAGIIASTLENLKNAASGENHEHTFLYPHFADIAKKEGFSKIALTYKAISEAEKEHEKRFLSIYKDIEKKLIFNQEKLSHWRCLNCGYSIQNNNAPNKCPACAHPQSYFELTTRIW